ncbi:mitogen-activated protein kinase kinase kinase 1-like [Oryza brachyantha]|uniref:mitogen-activated protein kinase kinase kinase 1-like n=1 Tax=Oryza brachyantha TaxID=4533 RepID=UPI0007761AD5|nr:mitogen-activated protein kinase kinase kinase 1-like [Oryza brachyantha]
MQCFVVFSFIESEWTDSLSYMCNATLYCLARDGSVFAVKEASLIGPESYAKQSAGQLEQEILLLSQLEHKNILQYFGAKKEETVLCIFLEYVSEGSLVSVYEKQKLEESTISSYTRQILHGLTYLHHHNVMHRDIKCANILVDQNGIVKVGDFGLAKEIKVWKQKRSCTGSVYWMAPEVVCGNPYGYSADIWSLGCTVLEMLTRRIPYPDDNWVSVFYQIGRGQLPPVPASISPVARDFIDNCLVVNPDDRPSADELLNHPFVALPEPNWCAECWPGLTLYSSRLALTLVGKNTFGKSGHPVAHCFLPGSSGPECLSISSGFCPVNTSI